jgi:hypothetical protein
MGNLTYNNAIESRALRARTGLPANRFATAKRPAGKPAVHGECYVLEDDRRHPMDGGTIAGGVENVHC